MNKIGWFICALIMICGGIALSLPKGTSHKRESFTVHCGTARVVCK
ncbi:MAG: hypothetical protein RL160_1617, partial [Bacteroidota bacterium]